MFLIFCSSKCLFPGKTRWIWSNCNTLYRVETHVDTRHCAQCHCNVEDIMCADLKSPGRSSQQRRDNRRQAWQVTDTCTEIALGSTTVRKQYNYTSVSNTPVLTEYNYTSVSSTLVRTQQNYSSVSSTPICNKIFTLHLAAHQYVHNKFTLQLAAH